MHAITIDATGLAAVRIFAAEADIRYCLNAVQVEANAKQTRLVATDGHMLGLHDAPVENELGCDFVSTLVPLSAIDSLKADLKLPVVLNLAEDGKSGTLSQFGKQVAFIPVDGKFPDFKRVIPVEISGESSHFAHKLLIRIFKAQQLFDKKQSPLIWHNGTSSALVELRGCDRFIGVLMPINPNGSGKPLPTVPDTAWARQSLQPAKAKDSETAFLD